MIYSFLFLLPNFAWYVRHQTKLILIHEQGFKIWLMSIKLNVKKKLQRKNFSYSNLCNLFLFSDKGVLKKVSPSKPLVNIPYIQSIHKNFCTQDACMTDIQTMLWASINLA